MKEFSRVRDSQRGSFIVDRLGAILGFDAICLIAFGSLGWI